MPSAAISQTIDLGSVTVSGANAANWVPSVPCRLLRITYVGTTAITVASAVITGSIEQADGTATDPTGASALGLMTLTVAAGTLNGVITKDLQATMGDLIVYPGESVDLTSDGGATAGAGRFYLEVEPLGFNDVDMRAHVTSHPGSTDLATSLAGRTEVTA